MNVINRKKVPLMLPINAAGGKIVRQVTVPIANLSEANAIQQLNCFLNSAK